MDVTYFLKKRTDFIRFYYEASVKPFETLKHQIEEKLPPFDDPPYGEDPEPPFLDEWMDADTAITVLGHSCLSILSDSLKLYFQSLQKRVIGFDFENKKKAFNRGFPQAYKAVLGHILDTDWKDCPADFDLIEQVVLARNRSQHGADLASFLVHHDADTLKKHPKPFFASEQEREVWEEQGGDPDSIMFAPSIAVSREHLFAAIENAEKLAAWIDGRLEKAWEWRAGTR